VRYHHEYLDGSGYPDALMAPEIPDLVRLLTISDIFSALIESRPYRAPMLRQDALHNPVRDERKAGAVACEGIPECSTCGMKRNLQNLHFVVRATPYAKLTGCRAFAATLRSMDSESIRADSLQGEPDHVFACQTACEALFPNAARIGVRRGWKPSVEISGWPMTRPRKSSNSRRSIRTPTMMRSCQFHAAKAGRGTRSFQRC
jgi:hypothetical protein